ncbi:hypothetical protein ACQZV8_05900 [Magnetococcales bacterium HHB-1]
MAKIEQNRLGVVPVNVVSMNLMNALTIGFIGLFNAKKPPKLDG